MLLKNKNIKKFNKGRIIRRHEISDFENPFKYSVRDIQKKVQSQYKPYEYDSTYLNKKDHCDPDDKSFNLQKHQMFVAEYSKNVTNMLVFHGLGSGKTCTSIAAAELHKFYSVAGEQLYEKLSEKEMFKVIICCPANLEMTYREELLGKCSSQVLINDKPQSYKTKEESKMIDMLRDEISYNLEEVKLNKNNKSKIKQLQAENKRNQTRITELLKKQFSSVRKNYEILSHDKFKNKLFKTSGAVGNPGELLTRAVEKENDISWLTRPNTLLIIDEVQNIVSINKGVLYQQFNRALRNYIHPNTRIILLTATPMFNRPIELGLTMNLLNPRLSFPSEEKAFNELFNIDTNEGIVHTPKLFKHFLNGYVSYFSGGNPEAYPYVIQTRVESELSRDQLEYYKTELMKDIKTYTKPRDIIGWLPDDPEMGTSKGIKLFPNARQALMVNKKDLLMKELAKLSKESDNRNKLTLIKAHSTKFHKVVTISLKSRRPVFIYTSLVVQGVKPLFSIFRHLGYKTFGSDTKEGDRIVAFSHGGTPQEERKRIIDAVNNKEIDVLISTVTEGISLKGLEQIHIVEPWWNLSRGRQIAARGVRFKSHCGVPPEERYVQIFNHIACLPEKASNLGIMGEISEHIRSVMGDLYVRPEDEDKNRKMKNLSLNQFGNLTIDQVMLKSAERKAVILTQMENLLKDSAVDKNLNKNANVIQLSEYYLPDLKKFNKYHLMYKNQLNGDLYRIDTKTPKILVNEDEILSMKYTGFHNKSQLKLYKTTLEIKNKAYIFPNIGKIKPGTVHLEIFNSNSNSNSESDESFLTAAHFKRIYNHPETEIIRNLHRNAFSKKLAAGSKRELETCIRKMADNKGILSKEPKEREDILQAFMKLNPKENSKEIKKLQNKLIIVDLRKLISEELCNKIILISENSLTMKACKKMKWKTLYKTLKELSKTKTSKTKSSKTKSSKTKSSNTKSSNTKK